MNVIVMSLDTLRAQSMSCYGHSHLTTPHLDRFVAQGTLFETCISPHIPTHPAHTALFTGQDVFTHQIVTQGGKRELEADVRMLAEILNENGYFCAAADNMGRWFSRGFEVYEGYSWGHTPEGGARKAEAVNETAFRVIDHARSQDQPWFLFLHYWDPHTPYQAPPPFPRMFYAGDEFDPDNPSMDPVFACEPFKYYFMQWMGHRDPDTGEMHRWTDRACANAAYDAEIAYLDAALAALWEHLAWEGLFDDVLLVITSDHGEELDEHALWYDHHGLYETNLHVPLILRGPGVPAGQRLGGLVTLMDMAPTILDFLGRSDLAEAERMAGRSLKPLLESGSSAGTTERVYVTECAWMKKRGFRTPEWKFIWETGDTPPVYKKDGPELYYLPDDPGEQHNLAAERPDRVAEFRQEMEAYIAQRLEATGQPDPQAVQDITLRQIGKPEAAVRKEQGVEGKEDVEARDT